ncbi:MAG: DEAD/DEAH box helicase, partial [Nocardioides sp.]
ILAPTRELVGQIDAALAPLAQATGLTTRTIFGGVGQNPQVYALRKGVDILVACPGRLEDLIAQGHCSLGDVAITVLDEADHMADLGFLPAVRRLLTKTPAGSQRLLFSATLDKGIDVLVRQFLVNPVTHEADSAQSPVGTMTHHVLHVERDQRLSILVDLTSAPGRTMVFTRTKHGAKALTKQLNRNGVPAVELHGNLGQNARTRNLEAFSNGEATALVATDIAARGIHVDDVTLVVHADPPAEHKAYLHRSGRTARAGNEGTVVTLMTSDQTKDVRALTKAAGINPTITRVDSTSHPVLVELAPGERTRSGAIELTEHGAGVARTGKPAAKASNAGRSGGSRSGGRSGSRPQGGSGSRSQSGSGSGSTTGSRSSRPAAAAGAPSGRATSESSTPRSGAQRSRSASAAGSRGSGSRPAGGGQRRNRGSAARG